MMLASVERTPVANVTQHRERRSLAAQVTLLETVRRKVTQLRTLYSRR